MADRYANRMQVDVVTLDGSPTYSQAQEILMDKVAEAFHEMLNCGLLVKVVLRDTSHEDILNLNGLD